MDSAAVFEFLLDKQAAGQSCVLVTVAAVEGSSMRDPGTIMGVAQDGSFAGSLSGGCIENAVVKEALDALQAGASRFVRFGAGSPYLDIRLPCGGGLDICFTPLDGPEFAQLCQEMITQRRPFAIEVGVGFAKCLSDWLPTQFSLDKQAGTFGYWPKPRLQIIGHGASVEALAKQAMGMRCDVAVLSPDSQIGTVLNGSAAHFQELTRADQSDLLNSDPWTATIFLFHDHDWEIDLMMRALEMPHFYLGAMGGRKAHAWRSEVLLARGVSDVQIDTICAPIGLFHSSRDPQSLALSTLAEVIQAYQRTDFEAALA